MDFTNPFQGMVSRKMTREELARAIRIDLAAELDAINLYQAHIDATDDVEIKKVIADIRDEEKEHVAEFTELLKMLDPIQVQEFEMIPAHIAGILARPLEHESPAEEAASYAREAEAQASAEQAAPAPAESENAGEGEIQSAPARPGFTIGSLLGKE
jgi:uncharacterized protein